MVNSASRCAEILRETAETQIKATLALDGGDSKINSGVPFFDHMLAQTARHGGLALDLQAAGDLPIDAHHTVEDCGIVFGQLLAAALGDKSSIARFGYAYAPLDESLSRVVVDISGRSSLTYQAALSRRDIGGMDADLLREFFQAMVNHAQITVHIDLLRGVNAHHQAESIFKAFGLSLRMATAKTGGGLPSTKGVL